MSTRLVQDRRGATAILFALAIIPLLAAVGGAADFGRMLRAQSALQEISDSAALSAASGLEADEASLKLAAERFIRANHREDSSIRNVQLTGFDLSEEGLISVSVGGDLPATFMSIFGFDTLDVGSTSVVARGYPGQVELVLVLDNTWSMSEADATGATKIKSLKSSANMLVDELKKDKNADIKLGVVPYSDYIHIPTKYRNESWLDVPDDYQVKTEKVCETKTTKQICTKTQVGSKKTCTRTVDGVEESYDCTKYDTSCKTVDVPPYESCKGGSTTNYKWFGCIASRKEGTLRLTDASPSTPYPGILNTSQRCLNEVQPLTDNSGQVKAAINSMIINIGGYKPSTYIPAGMVWGINLLSPSKPFTEGAAYDDENRAPRKVIVLMTDGENTLRFQSSDGLHVSPSGSTSKKAQQIEETDADTVALCDYAKSQKIEIFTIAFAVDQASAQDVLESCASGPDHYFDAVDAGALQSAFSSIARSLREIRLVQ